MALRYWVGATSNDWGNTANWSDTSGGAGGFSLPGTADDVFFNASSGNCDMNANRAIKSVNFTGYTNTLAVATYQLQVHGNVTFQANQSSRINGTTGILRIHATSTITSNGGTWPLSFGHAANITITLADDMRVSLDLTSTANIGTYNGFKLYIGRDILSSGNYLGTTDIIMNGTGTCTLPGIIGLEVDTAGTITITGNTLVNRRFVVTNAGSITMTGANLTTGQTNATTINVGGRTIGDLTVGSYASVTTISTDVYCNNYSGGNSNGVNGPGKIYVNGSIGGNLATGNVAFVCIGSGNISGNIGGGGLTVNTSGSYTTSGNMFVSSQFIIVGASNISLTGATAFTFSGGATIDVGGRSFGSVVFQSSLGTVTVASDMYCTSYGAGNGPVINGPGRIYVNGPYSGGTAVGNVVIELIGSGNFSGNISTNLVINTSGTYTFTSNINIHGGRTLTHNQGTINPQTFLFQQNNLPGATFNINAPGFNLYNWTLPNIGSPQTYTINSTNGNVINVLNNLSIINNNPTFAGNSGWRVANWSETTAGRGITLTAGNTYTVTNLLTLTGTNASPIVIASSSPTVRANLNLEYGASQTVQFVTATRIDSSAGQTIWDTLGTGAVLTNTLNWNNGARPAPFNTLRMA